MTDVTQPCFRQYSVYFTVAFSSRQTITFWNRWSCSVEFILILILFPMNSKCALYWLIGLELRVWCSCAAVKHKHNLLTWNCSSRAVIFLLMCYITLMFTCVFSQVRLMGISQAKLLAVVACLHVDNRYLLCTVRFLYSSRSSVVVPAH